MSQGEGFLRIVKQPNGVDQLTPQGAQGRWKLLILWALRRAEERFSDSEAEPG